MFVTIGSINNDIYLFRRRSNACEKADSTLIGQQLLFKVLVQSLYNGDTPVCFNEPGKMQDWTIEVAMFVILLKERSYVIYNTI